MRHYLYHIISDMNTLYNIEEYKFNFKLAYGDRIITYGFPPNLSIKNFIESVSYNARLDFNLRNDQSIEIIEAGQEEGEQAMPLISSNEPLRQIYGNRHEYTAFYIRVIQFHQN